MLYLGTKLYGFSIGIELLLVKVCKTTTEETNFVTGKFEGWLLSNVFQCHFNPIWCITASTNIDVLIFYYFWVFIKTNTMSLLDTFLYTVAQYSIADEIKKLKIKCWETNLIKFCMTVVDDSCFLVFKIKLNINDILIKGIRAYCWGEGWLKTGKYK